MESINSHNWDEPRALDLEMLRDHLKFLKRRMVVKRPVLLPQRNQGRLYEIRPSDLIILEGLFCLCDPVADELDLKIFVDVSRQGGLLRRIVRDIHRTGQSEQKFSGSMWKRVYPMYKLHMSLQIPADIIIINEYNPETEAKGRPSGKFWRS